MRTKKTDLLETLPLPVERFSSGEAARILGTKMRRLNNFLENYPLSSSGQLGKGRGSRRMFSREDLYRIAVASRLIRDGFTPKLVVRVLQDIEDRDLIDVDEHMRTTRIGILFRRGKTRPQLDFFKSGHAGETKADSSVYYALDLGSEVMDEIDRRIQKSQSVRKR